jgi:hypothetical protein
MWRRADQKWRLLLYQFLKVFLNSNMRTVENFELFDVEARGPCRSGACYYISFLVFFFKQLYENC